MIINHNMASLNTYRQMAVNESNTSSSLAKLSSGLRINKAGDDAAGLAISEKMRGQIRGLDQASRNAQDSISLINTAEGSLSETHSILQRMKELATQAGNDTNTTTDRSEIQKEMNQLTSEINRIGNTTEFNTQKLLNGNISAEAAAKVIGAGSTVTAGLTNLTVGDAATNGKYKITVTNETINSVVGTGSGITGASVAAVDSAIGTTLAEGAYKVQVATTANAKDTATVTDDATNAVLNTAGGNKAVTIDANGTLTAKAGYTLEVAKTKATTTSVLNAGGVSNVTGATLKDGTYEITTGAVASGDGAIKQGGSAVISNVTLANGSTLQNADAYKINLVEKTDAADASGTMTFTFKLTKGGADVAGTQIDVNVTASSGSQNIKLGDVSFDVDLTKLWASDDHDGALASTLAGNDEILTINNQITVHKAGTDASTAVPHTFTADTLGMEFDLGTEGKLNLDAKAATFARGNTYNVTVASKDSYAISVKDGATVQGTAATLTGDDISGSPAKFTNIYLGNGVLVDLDTAKLAAMTSGTTAKAAFDVTSSSKTTATLMSADGATTNSSVVIADPTTAGSVELGTSGLNFSYGANVADGEQFFAVTQSTDNFKMTLQQDTDGNGSYDADVVSKQSFRSGDIVHLGATGITIDTKTAVAATDSATFEVKDGVGDKSLKMQVGANTAQSMSIDVSDMRSKALKISSDAKGTVESKNVGDDGKKVVASYVETASVTDGTNNTKGEFALDVSSHDKATAAITIINDAIETVSAERSKLGAFTNRLEHTITNLGTSSENLTAAESRIRDVDMAKEMMNFQKNNILQQAAQAMLAQANQQPQGVLQLLR